MAPVSTKQRSGENWHLSGHHPHQQCGALDTPLPYLPGCRLPLHLKVREKGEKQKANNNSPGQIYLFSFCYCSMKWKDPETWRPQSRRSHTQEMRSSGWQNRRSTFLPQLPSAWVQAARDQERRSFAPREGGAEQVCEPWRGSWPA